LPSSANCLIRDAKGVTVTAVLELLGQQVDIDDDRFYEIVCGERVEKKPMGTPQNLVCTAFASYLRVYVRQERLGTVAAETLFVLDEAIRLERRPDLAYVSRQRWQRPTQTGAWNVVPDLAVEMISPTNRAPEVLQKIDEYFAAGVRLVWVVYCQPRQVYVYRSPVTIQVLTPQDTLEGDDVIPGFSLPVAKLFEDLDEADPSDS
jgi:Uma2 family endonuclease